MIRVYTMSRSSLRLAAIRTFLLALSAMVVVACGSAAPAASTTASATPIASPTPSAGPASVTSPTPGVTPYPLVDGEAWIVLDNGGVAEAGGARLIRPDGTDGHEILADLPVNVAAPAWSPDGRQLVFDGEGDRGSQLWVANADGTGARALMPTPDGCPSQCTEAIQPTWSRDGRSIAYVASTHEGGAFTKSALAILDIATGETREIYATTDTTLAWPSWSPDGGTIAIEIDRYAGVPEDTELVSSVIGLITVAGEDHVPKEITEPSLLAGYPSWHPTDDLIVVRTNRYDVDRQKVLDEAAPSDLYTLRADGSGLTNITHNVVGGAIIRAPSWTSDGRILFSKLAEAGAEEQLRVIGATGENEASATGDVVTLGEGYWRPTP